MLPTPHAWHISLLQAAYASDAELRLGDASPYHWAAACHEMFEAGLLDVLEFAARYLHAAYPEMDYLATLVVWFDAVPRHLPPPLEFCDDPATEVQVVRNAGSDVVLFCFCARHGTLGLPLNFVHQWLGRLPVNLVYIKDHRDLCGGMGFPEIAPDRASSIKALRRIARDLGAKRILTLGVSAGGYAAMYYGLQLDAEAVLNLAGATDLSREFLERVRSAPGIYRSLLQKVPEYAMNLRARYESANGRPCVLIAYSAGSSRDREQAERMAGLPGVELIAVRDSARHNVIDPLIRQGALMGLLQRFVTIERAGWWRRLRKAWQFRRPSG